ncbi:hypothetical protein C8A05DRAFT_17840 [Staphylotrichum tortipilum]|uniref:Uncharacterized protein n=1 Tax=Staphylotrichum tortipilum TaxID=2831512 RepID=A0AAN6MGM1_9PEZI|nr:hypothetical protein C8A05DRAFT_17840 [Staphylotrichum longicolle]
MTVGSDFRVSLPALGTSHANYALGLDSEGLVMSQPRQFKRHKVLPHPPRKDDALPSSLLRYGLGSDSSLPQNGASTPSTPSSCQRTSRLTRGPEPPPTPPAHSRTSSASHPTDPSSPNNPGTPSASTSNVASRPPVTPPAQQTPPTPNLTPDRTPPGPAAALLIQRRPPVSERNSSRVTTDSRAESFRTAPENPYSSDDDGEGKTPSRPPLPLARPSYNTARHGSAEKRSFSHPVGLGLGLGSGLVDDATPRTVAEFDKFDGEWTGGEGQPNVAGEWDGNLMRNVTIRKRRPTRSAELRNNPEVVDDRTVTPTNATKALRSMSLQESPVLRTQRRVVSDRLPASATALANSDSSSSIEIKRSSVMSTKSNASTVVEAMLVIEMTPQRRQTLRHVRKHIGLRDSSSEISPPSSAPTSVSPAADDRRRRHEPSDSKAGEAVRESYASTATNTSISSRKARRSVWKSGGVPVVVIPERRSSVSKSPSLRSTSSRRTRSLSSVPISNPSRSRDLVAQFERPGPARRSRAMSESDGSRAGDERTMDFPPVIPTRSSSLSAPTSRNPSRTASLTTESLTAHNMFQAQKAHQALQTVSRELDKLNGRSQQPGASDGSRDTRTALGISPMSVDPERGQPTITVERAAHNDKSETGESPAHARRDRDPHTTPVDRDGDPFFGKRLSVQNTPFSVASVETTGTSHAELSEAMAVNIYPHQSKSVVLVNHSAKPSESSTVDQYRTVAGMTDKNAVVPSTPPPQFTLGLGDVDSPLRNPRAPPIPPAINFIPATPSGLTPSTEKKKQLGNFYEITAQKPRRSLSLLRRALSRRTADYGPSSSRPAGLLTRTFSLSRRSGDGDGWPRLKRHSTADDALPDESRLHPFWRPAYADDSDSSCSDSDDSYDESESDDEDRTYRYPPIDNRPSPPRRSLSTRIKRTFSILPQTRRRRDRYDEEEHYPATADDAPDRRTIRRTPSGNLRVMKFRRSMESLTRAPVAEQGVDGRPYTAPAHQELHSAAGAGRFPRLIRSLSNKARRSVRRRGSSVSQAGVGEGVGSETTPAAAPAPPAPTTVTTATTTTTTGFLPALGERINIPRRLSERRRERRTQELRGMISAPREVRDGVGEVIRRELRAGPFRDRDALYVREQQEERQRLRAQLRMERVGRG